MTAQSNILTVLRGLLCILVFEMCLGLMWFAGAFGGLSMTLWWTLIGLGLYAVVIGSPGRFGRPRRLAKFVSFGVVFLYGAIAALDIFGRVESPGWIMAAVVLAPAEFIIVASSMAADRSAKPTEDGR